MGELSHKAKLNAEIRAEPLKAWLESINAIVDEHRHHVTETGFRASAVDPANAAMVQTVLGANEFEEFDCEKCTIGIDTEKLMKSLKKAGSDDLVTLEFDEETRRLAIEYGPMSRELATIDPDVIRHEPDMPDLDYLGSVIVSTDHMNDAIWSCEMIADQVTIELLENESIVFRTDGDTDRARTELGEEYLHGSEISGAGGSLLSINYLNDIIRALSCDLVELSVGDELPLEIVGEIGENSRAKYVVAPRIGN